MIYILLISCLALIGFNTYLQLKKKQQPKKEPEPEQPPLVPAAIVIKQLLQRLNCNYKIRETHDEEEIIEFDYQGGHFNVAAATKTEVFKLGFMYFFSTDTDNLETVRNACNQLNLHSRLSRFVYSHEPAQHQIFAHLFISSVIVNSMPRVESFWRSMLDSCFEHKRIFLQHYDTLKGHADEQVEMDSDRTLFLMREHEIAQQDLRLQNRSTEYNPYSLIRFVEEAMDMPGTETRKLVITDDRLAVITDMERIKAYPLTSALIEGEGKDAHFKHKHVQLTLTLRHPNSQSRVGVIMLQAEQETTNSLYFRATYCVPPFSVSKDHTLSDKSNAIETFSILMAYDKIDLQEEIEKISRIWNDALEKSDQGKYQELSSEQKFMLDCTFIDEHSLVYKGHKAFMKKRYYEAIFYLEQVFNSMNDHFHEMKESQRKVFYEVNYYLGFCYNDLGLYHKAYYFLDTILNQNKISYTKEYIISLVNARDFRALNVINTILDKIGQIEEDQDEEEKTTGTAAIRKFANFLKKEKGYILVEMGAFQEAETLYRELLKDPENEKIALIELAHLEQLKKEE